MFEMYVVIVCCIIAAWQMYKISMTDKYEEIRNRETLLIIVAIIACVMLLGLW